MKKKKMIAYDSYSYYISESIKLVFPMEKNEKIVSSIVLMESSENIFIAAIIPLKPKVNGVWHDMTWQIIGEKKTVSSIDRYINQAQRDIFWIYIRQSSYYHCINFLHGKEQTQKESEREREEENRDLSAPTNPSKITDFAK